MEKTIQAIYQDGVRHPLEPLPFKEQQQVTITISEVRPNHPLLISSGEWNDDISLDEVRRALSTIQGSLSEAVLEQRRPR